MSEPLDEAGFDTLFRTARTYNAWKERPVPADLPQQLYALMKWGPTSANVSPARFVIVMTPEGKARLSPFLSKGNHDKTMAAPVTVIVAYDLDFADKLPILLPHAPSAASWFADPAVKQETAMRNSSLQGAYMILAARALGYDCGPMSGFNQAGVNEAFFAGTNVKSNFLINIGYGDPEVNLFPRSPRLPFEDACTMA